MQCSTQKSIEPKEKKHPNHCQKHQKRGQKGPFYSVKRGLIPVFSGKGLKKSIEHKEWGLESILVKILVLYRFFRPPAPKPISGQNLLVAPRHFSGYFNLKQALYCLRKYLFSHYVFFRGLFRPKNRVPYAL